MSSTAIAEPSALDFAATYARDGFAFPRRIVPATRATEIRADLEAAEAELADRPSDLALLRAYPDRLLPSFDALVREPAVVDAAQQILGPDLLVWSAGLFIKEANSPSYVTWHQDLTYWGLDDAEEVTAWIALSTANVASGCMRFIPGSHRQRQVAHSDSFAEDNLLTRGQEIAVEVNEDDAVSIELEPGEASFHHGHLFHSSGPNTTPNRRIGTAVRFISPKMRQTGGARSLVALVAGEDCYGHFEIADPPKGRLTDADFARCREDAARKRAILYEGAEDAAGKRY